MRKKEKILSMLLCMALCLTLLPTVAFAADERPTYSGGNGTKENPWLISSVEDLQTLQETINNGAAADIDADADNGGSGVAGNYYGYYFKQTCDLDLSGIKSWDPIGYSGNYYFAGNYDGGGYTISGMTSTGKNDDDGYATAGLFGWVAFGSVTDVHIEGANLKATGNKNYSYAGGIAGVVYDSSVTNCSVKNSFIESIRTDNNNCAGGIAGYSTGGTFNRCSVENAEVKTMAYGGGFVGEINDDNGVGTSSFTNCFVTDSKVTAYTDNTQGLSFAGGFAGELTATALTVENCFVYNTDAIIGENSAPPTLKATGVFAGHQWQGETYSPINATNCYFFTNEESPEKFGAATRKTAKEFASGEVCALLGDEFGQVLGENGDKHPVFKTKDNQIYRKTDCLNNPIYTNDGTLEDGQHRWNDGEVTTEPTYEAPGVMTYTCTACGITKTEGIPQKAHSFSKTWSKDETHHWHNCTEDGCTEISEKAEHTWNDGEVTTEPTYTTEGVKTYTCTVCGQTKTETIDKLTRPSSGGVTTYAISIENAENGEVSANRSSASRGTTVTLTAEPDKGYILESITVTDKNGDKVKLTEKDGKYTFTMPASKVTVEAAFAKENPDTGAWENPFADVVEGAWYYDSIRYTYENGLIAGYPNGLFGINDTITRGQIATILWRMEESPVVNCAMTFEDVGEGMYYADAIRWAASEGIVGGYSDTQFGPNDAITREQLAAILWRYAQHKGYDVSVGEDTNILSYADALTVSEWAVPAMQWANGAGLIQGSDNNLMPKGNATRAQAAAILHRFCETVTGE